MSSDPRIGTTLGAYRIESVLGRGGMGVVYLAEHVRLRKKMALKILPPELADDEEFRRRFERESQTAAMLDHPNIVPVHDAGEVEGLLYMAMRFVEGTDLARAVRSDGALDPDRALSILGQTAAALDEAHAAGLVHRDVKPANILLAPRRGEPPEHVFLTDFGLAKQWASTSRLTRSGYFVGTIHYSPPEQFTGGELDARADVYSLGCVLYECLTGEVPFERTHEPAIMYAHLQDPPPAVTAKRPGLPPGIDEVVATAMAKTPEARFDGCGELVRAAAAALGEDVPAGAAAATTASGSGRATVRRAPRPDEGTPTDPGPGRPQGRRGLLVGLAAILAVLLVAGGVTAILLLGDETPRVRGNAVDPTGTGPSPSVTAEPTDTSEPPVGEAKLQPVVIVAQSNSAPGMDACGNEVPFNSERMIDGDPTTAWRTGGDASGQTINLGFSETMRITRVGIIPGYAKVDPCDGTDRFPENRTVRQVTYSFAPDIPTVTQRLAARAEVQYVEVDVEANSLEIRIDRTSPPGVRDYTAISEIEVYGAPVS